MKRFVCLAFVAFLAANAFAATAFAADRYEYCRWYALTAVRQAALAREVRSCRHLIEDNPARWQTSVNEHFQWCLSAFGSGGNAREHDARDAELRACGAI